MDSIVQLFTMHCAHFSMDTMQLFFGPGYRAALFSIRARFMKYQVLHLIKKLSLRLAFNRSFKTEIFWVYLGVKTCETHE